jgi:hypothetical protein
MGACHSPGASALFHYRIAIPISPIAGTIEVAKGINGQFSAWHKLQPELAQK